MLIHICDNTYLAPDQVASVEGFYQTLLVRVTSKKGRVYEFYVSEQRLDWIVNKRKGASIVSAHNYTREMAFSHVVAHFAAQFHDFKTDRRHPADSKGREPG